MLEKIAKTKWCPHARMVFGYDKGTTQPFNRFATEPGDEMEKMQKAMNGTSGTKCLGSACMVWQPDQRLEQQETKRDEGPPDGEGWNKRDRSPGQPKDVWFRYVDDDSGDCGLKQWPVDCRASC